MVQRTFYMVSSIIMDGAVDKKTLTEARVVAKREAKKLEKQGKYHKISDSRDMWVTIDKYNATTGKDTIVESWKWTGTKFIQKSINKLLG